MAGCWGIGVELRCCCVAAHTGLLLLLLLPAAE